MIELVFVIAVLGIVASIGAEIIAKVYEGYIVQRAEHRATLKTELAATQIANRLASAIPGTVYRKRRSAAGVEDWVENITTSLGHPAQADQYNVLQWVGSDNDSFNTHDTVNQKIGWSGLCDLDNPATTGTNVVSPGSDFSITNTVVTNLNGGSLPAAWRPVIYFPYDNTAYPVSTPLAAGNNLGLTGTGASHMVEHYKFAWTSYALVVDDGDLYLYYGFDPIAAFAIPNGTSRSLLLKNVTTFKFKGAGRTIRFKICKQENIGEDFNITACKEKAVF